MAACGVQKWLQYCTRFLGVFLLPVKYPEVRRLKYTGDCLQETTPPFPTPKRLGSPGLEPRSHLYISFDG
jgi:hypothetical protein